MKEILKLREKILKQDYLNSDIMKITEAISHLDDTLKKLSKDTKMHVGQKTYFVKEEILKLKTSILLYAKKHKSLPAEISELVRILEFEWAVEKLMKLMKLI